MCQDLLKLQVVNLGSGRSIDMDPQPQVIEDSEIMVSLLTPNTKYLFTVINEKDGGKYFQKVLETNSFGIKLEKAYATSDSLAYNIIIDEGTDITNARLTLYKFNEKTKKNEVVIRKYYDPVKKEDVIEEMVFDLSELGDKLEGTYEKRKIQHGKCYNRY